MASCITSQWVATAPQARLTVVEDSSTGSTVTLKWTLDYIASSPASTSGSNQFTVTIDGDDYDFYYSINGKTGTNKIASDTVTISKGSSSKTISFSVTAYWNLSWSKVFCSTKSASGSITVGGKTSYTISYDANGGTGAPSSQTKTHGVAVTLSSTRPTRSGYSFKGWGIFSSASYVYYDPGDEYTDDESILLYAIWEANTYTVSYSANGGTGAPSSQTKTHDVALTLSNTKPTRTNYAFMGWGTSKSSTTVAYSAGAKYTENANVTLYAIWELMYVKPRIDNYNAVRCTSAGVEDAKGTCAKVSFDWKTDRSVTGITIRWRLSTSTAWIANVTVSASGTSGSASKVIGGNALDPESVYIVQVEVRDGTGDNYVSTENTTLGGTIFAIDFKAGGKGVALGKAAELDNIIELGMKTRMYDNMCFIENEYGRGMLGGVTSEGEEVYNIQPVSENGNCTVGYGNYDRKSGNTNIYGHGVNVYANENVNFNGENINMYASEAGAIFARSPLKAVAGLYIGDSNYKVDAYVEKSGSERTGHIQYASGLTIQWGYTEADSIPGEPCETYVKFPIPYKYPPFVMVNLHTTVIGTTVLGGCARDITTEEFTILVTRINSAGTTTMWLAVGFSDVT